MWATSCVSVSLETKTTEALWTRQDARLDVGNVGAWNSSQAVSWGSTVSPWETTAGSHLDKSLLILRIFSESMWLHCN